MAKHPKRRMGRYIKGNVQNTLDLGTLAAKTLISATLGGTVEERSLISSIVSSWALSDFTNAIGDGPIAFGVAHSDYSDAEIEEVLELTGTWKEGDLKAQEVMKRKVRRIGVFPSSPSDSSGNVVVNDGRPIKTKLNWILQTGKTLKIWAYNMGDSAIATTDPDMTVLGHVNLFPK